MLIKTFLLLGLARVHQQLGLHKEQGRSWFQFLFSLPFTCIIGHPMTCNLMFHTKGGARPRGKVKIYGHAQTPVLQY